MKKTICIINENHNEYIFSFSCLKINGHEISRICEFEKRVLKRTITLENSMKEIINGVGRTLNLNHYLYVPIHYVYNLNSLFLTRFSFPKISQNEIKKSIQMEMNKQILNYDDYHGLYRFYNGTTDKKTIIEVKLLSMKKKLYDFCSVFFSNLPMKVKTTPFLFDSLRMIILRMVSLLTFTFVYINKDYLLINQYCNREIISIDISNQKYDKKMNKQDLSDLVKRLVIHYGTYYRDISKDICLYTEIENALEIKDSIEQTLVKTEVTILNKQRYPLDMISLISKYSKDTESYKILTTNN